MLQKYFFIIFLLFFVFPSLLSFNHVSAANICDDCCQDNDCSSNERQLECVGVGDSCQRLGGGKFSGEVGQCQPKDSVVFCPFSKHKKIEDLIDAVSKWIFRLALVIAPLMVLIGGFYMFMAAGDPGRATKGKKVIIWAMAGLGVILFAKAFISIIKFVLK